MKKLIAAVFCTALAFNSELTAYAENLDRDYIETEIWEEIWHGKGDDGTVYPEASYKHHLLEEWLDENYGSDEYDWAEIGELKYAYKNYYRDYIENFDFEDDNNGNWTIDTPEHSYSFTLFQGEWNMLDENGNTVETFPTFSTLEEDSPESETTDGYKIQDDGADSPRVVGKVTEGSQTASESLSDTDSNDTTESVTGDSKGNSGAFMLIFAGVAVVAGIGGFGYYIVKRKR